MADRKALRGVVAGHRQLYDERAVTATRTDVSCWYSNVNGPARGG